MVENGQHPAEVDLPHQDADMEAIVHHTLSLHDNLDGIKRRDPARLMELDTDIHQLPEYKAYIHQAITVETLDSILEDFDQQAVGEGATERRRQLAELVSDIKSNIQGYFSSITAAENYKRANEHRLDPRTLREGAVPFDHNRRNLHNALISNLTALSRFCYQTLPNELGVEIPREKLFTSEQLDDRNYIGAWAYNTERGRRIVDVLHRVEQELKKKTAEA